MGQEKSWNSGTSEPLREELRPGLSWWKIEGKSKRAIATDRSEKSIISIYKFLTKKVSSQGAPGGNIRTTTKKPVPEREVKV